MEVVAKAAASFLFYEIFYRTGRGMDPLLRRDLPMQPSGIPHLYAVCRARERALRHPAKVQREQPSNLLGTDRPLADRQNLPARRVSGIFPGKCQAEKQGWAIPDRDRAEADVGAADEAAEERTLGDCVRQGNGVDAIFTGCLMRQVTS